MRFNPPPGWPQVPPGWIPPQGWQPDPAWPPAPLGWQFWVEDTPASAVLAAPARGPRLAMLGAGAMFVGAFLPLFANITPADAVYRPGGGSAGGDAFIVALIFAAAAGAAYWSTPGRYRRGAVRGLAIALLVVSILEGLGCAGLTAAGMVGVKVQDDLFGEITVKYSPGIGLIVIFLSSLAIIVGAIRTLGETRWRK